MNNGPTSAGKSAERDTALDFTKGALVLVMVVYHWGNFYMRTAPHFFDLLRFLTPSFIFITGWLLGSLHLARKGRDNPQSHRRLAWRGGKLVLLFTVLNLAIHALALSRNRGGATGLQVFLGEFLQVYGSGNTGVSSFRILLPIGYLLVLAGTLLPLIPLSRGLIGAGLAGMVVALQMAELAGLVSTNLMLLSFGCLGFGLGFIATDRVSRLLRFWPGLLAVYLAYLALMLAYGPYYGVQLVGVILNLLVLYTVGMRLSLASGALRAIDLLSRYSLFAYIVQIAILQSLISVANYGPELPGAEWGVLTGTAVLMIAAVYLVEFLRRRSNLSDVLYRTVFN